LLRLEEPTEQRFGLPDAPPDLAIFLGQAAGQEVVSQVLRIVYRKFRGKPRHKPMEGKPRHVILYGPGGEVLKHVEVPSVPEEGD
jgi:hypothetical protein